MACQNPPSTSLLPSSSKSYRSLILPFPSPFLSRHHVFSSYRALAPPTDRRRTSSNFALAMKLHHSYPHRPSTAPPSSPCMLCKAAEYVFPDPIPEFAEAETSKFRAHLLERLSKKDIFQDSLEEIVLICTEGGNNIHARGVTEIAQLLKDNSIITTLELGYNPIGPDGAKALCEIINFHGKLETLKLGWCQIGAKGAEYVADALKYNTTLSTLDLRANGLGDDVRFYNCKLNLHLSHGAVCLARSLKVVNEALTSLDLGFNEIRDTGAFALAQALKSNEDLAVTSLNLASNFLTKYGQVALTEARDHVYEMSEKEISIYF